MTVQFTNVGKKGISKARGICDDFKAFITRGNVIDLAIGIIIGAAFTAIVNSLVNDIISPIIGLTSTKTLEELFVVMRYGNAEDKTNHTQYTTRADAKTRGAITLNYGNFFNTIINFIIIALCMFLIVKLISILYHKKVTASTDWPCPKCKEMVKEGAIRCPHCTSEPIAPSVVNSATVSDVY